MNYLDFNTFLYGKEYPIVKWEETDTINFWIEISKSEVKCPECGCNCISVHETHQRKIQDTPIHNKIVYINIDVREFKCENSKCNVKTFTEELPFVGKHQVRTYALTEFIITHAIYMSSSSTSLILSFIGVNVSADTVDKILKNVHIIEMNRINYKFLHELKIRYASFIYSKMFRKVKKNKYVYNGKKIILVMINAFAKNKKAVSTYRPVNEYGKVFTKYIEVKEFNLERLKIDWYNKVTISKHEKRLLYLLMTREIKREVAKFIKGDDILMAAEKIRDDLENGKIILDYDIELENEMIKQGIRETALEEGMAAGRTKGRAEGRAEEKKENAKKMKENGIPFNIISKITGLSKKQIMML